MYDPNQADDVLWASLHAEFSEPQLVELVTGSASRSRPALLKTLVAKQGELAAAMAKG